MTGQEYDVVVVGSGAAGMVAALTAAHQGLSTVVVEKAAHYGGSTARSGGGVWIPNNEILKRDGVKDTAEAARTYLHAIIGDVVARRERIDTYLDRGPEMLSFVLKHSPLKLCWVPGYSDYYPESAGRQAPAAGRSNPSRSTPSKLGADEAGPRAAVRQGAAEHGGDAAGLRPAQPAQAPPARRAAQPQGRRRATMWAKATGKNLVGMGRALIAPLRIGLQQAGVPVQLNTALTDLYVEDGVVRGIYVRDTNAPESAEPQLIRARRGVILGSGGFEHNEQMRVKYQRAPITTEWTVGAKANTGDGILAAEKLGAALDLMEDAWWGPTVPLVGRAVVRAVRAQLPRIDHRQHVGQAVHERVDALRRGLPPHVRRRVRPGPRPRREHPGLAGVRPAVPRPLHLRGTATGTTDSEEVAGVRRHRQGRHARRAGRARPACRPTR